MSDDTLIAKLAEEYTRELRAGNAKDIEEYARKYPQAAERIRELFPTLMLLEGMAGTGDTTSAEPVYPSALTAGSTFGQYRITREIGRGGMGIVYEAVHVLLEKQVALKVLMLNSLTNASSLERFFREARMAASLHHTNIVPVFDVGQIAGMPYYAMHYVDGRGLDAVMRAMQLSPAEASADVSSQKSQSETVSAIEAPSAPSARSRKKKDRSDWRFVDPSARVRAGLPARIDDYFRWVANIGIQAAQGLAHAHERKVIHRDIKPSNLLIDKQGVLWIADFGLARRIEDPAVTQSGALIGTPRYMSPEQAEAAKRPVDHRSDIYSLGVTLYELLTFRPVFEGKTPHDVISQILTREPVAPRRLNDEIPTDLSTIVMKAMAKRPEDRYQSASQLAEDLGRWIRMEPVKARRIGLIGRIIRWCRRNPRLSLVTAIAATIILVLSGIYYASLLKENANTRLALQRETAARSQAQAALGIAENERKRAEELQQEAESAREQAENEKGRAETERNIAEVQKREADLQRAEALYQSYRSNLLAADLSFQEGEIEAAKERLALCEPSYRGWEWHYLNKSIDMSLASQSLNSPDMHLPNTIARTVQEVAFEDEGKSVVIKAYQAELVPRTPTDPNPVILSAFRYIPDNKGSLAPAASGSRVVTISPNGSFALSTNWNLTDQNILCASEHKSESSPFACRPIATLSPFKAGSDSGSEEKNSGNNLIVTDTIRGRTLAILHHPNLGVWTGPMDVETRLKKTELSGREFAQYIKNVLINCGNYPNAVDGVFSQDNSLLATWSWDQVIHIWNLRTQSLITSLGGHKRFIVSASFSPDGTHIASSSLDGTVRLWSINEGKEVETFYVLQPSALAYSPDGEHIAVGLQSGLVHIFHVRKKHPPLKLEGHSGFISSMAFSPDSSRLVTAGFENHKIMQWDAGTGILLKTLVGHTEGVASVAYSPDGSRIVSGSRDGTIRIWSSRNILEKLGSRGKSLIALGLPPGGAGAVSFSADQTLGIWNTTQPEAVRTQKLNEEQRSGGSSNELVSPGFAAISRDKSLIATPHLIPGRSSSLPSYIPYIIDIHSRNPVFSGEILESYSMPQVSLNPDASRLAALCSKSRGGILQLMETASGRLLATWPIHDFCLKNGPMALSYDGSMVALAVDACTPKGRDPLKSTILVYKTGLPGAFLSIPGPPDTLAGQPEFFPDGRRLAFAAGNNVYIWDVEARKEIAVLRGHHNSIGAIAVSPDGSRIVTGGSDDTVRIWDADRYAHLFAFRISEANGICCLTISSDSMCIAAGTGSGLLYLWSARPPGDI